MTDIALRRTAYKTTEIYVSLHVIKTVNKGYVLRVILSLLLPESHERSFFSSSMMTFSVDGGSEMTKNDIQELFRTTKSRLKGEKNKPCTRKNIATLQALHITTNLKIKVNCIATVLEVQLRRKLTK